LEKEGIMLPVARMNVKYVLPAKYDDLIRIETQITELPRKTISFQHELYNPEGNLINIGETTLLFMSDKGRKIVTAPDDLVTALKPYFQE
jgi:acyl-CoA thioester hydrolase